MPRVPCQRNQKGKMIETATGKSLGSTYYVYKYKLPIFESGLPEDVWRPELEGNLGQTESADYLQRHSPRVCVRPGLYNKCSKKAPKRIDTPEAQLCEFVFRHRDLFFKIEGKPLDALRHCETTNS